MGSPTFQRAVDRKSQPHSSVEFVNSSSICSTTGHERSTPLYFKNHPGAQENWVCHNFPLCGPGRGGHVDNVVRQPAISMSPINCCPTRFADSKGRTCRGTRDQRTKNGQSRSFLRVRMLVHVMPKKLVAVPDGVRIDGWVVPIAPTVTFGTD